MGSWGELVKGATALLKETCEEESKPPLYFSGYGLFVYGFKDLVKARGTAGA